VFIDVNFLELFLLLLLVEFRLEFVSQYFGFMEGEGSLSMGINLGMNQL
jgi:hypothetical protein